MPDIPNIKYDTRYRYLGWVALVAFAMALMNCLEYYFAGKNYLRQYTGVVSDVDHSSYTSYDDVGNSTIIAKTAIRLEGISRKFSLSDDANYGGYVYVNKGDTVTLYVRKWYQSLYNFPLGSNVFYIEKNGNRLYNNLGEWKGAAKIYMLFFGGMALFLFVIYLDVVKNISIRTLIEGRQ